MDHDMFNMKKVIEDVEEIMGETERYIKGDFDNEYKHQ